MGYLLELRKLVGSRPLFSVGSTVLLFNDQNQVLMQLRSDTKTWGFPGGSSELGDSLLETAKRELLEETGLTAERFKLHTILSGKEYFYVYPNGDQIYNVAAIFLARGVSGTLAPDEESLELGWFASDNLPTPLVGPITRWMAEQLPRLMLEQF
jgi:8-oxo-dGTP pyrophosphatase MutT (NUDIX family)